MLVIEIREKAVEAVKAAEASKNSEASKGESSENLALVLCIQYPIAFRKKSVQVSALLGLSSEVNAIHPTLA